VSEPLLQSLQPSWEDDEIGSEVAKELVMDMLTQLTDAESREAATQMTRTHERVRMYKEELMKHVWHPNNAAAFEALAAHE
jgi:hypothetical protein